MKSIYNKFYNHDFGIHTNKFTLYIIRHIYGITTTTFILIKLKFFNNIFDKVT